MNHLGRRIGKWIDAPLELNILIAVGVLEERSLTQICPLIDAKGRNI